MDRTERPWTCKRSANSRHTGADCTRHSPKRKALPDRGAKEDQLFERTGLEKRATDGDGDRERIHRAS